MRNALTTALILLACLGALLTGGVPACAEEPFWAFQPPDDPPLPAVRDRDWAANPLDPFVLVRLEEKQLRPAPSADRRTLIRRFTFDLTGLPPTPAQVDAVLADPSPHALAKLTDRLLASPHYGERWGRHWLDVARYADSNGLDENYAYANAWRYRDYVIAAFNTDKSYDQFVTEQLAGDLLPAGDDESAYLDRMVATGFLAFGPKFLAEKDPQKMEMDIIDEQIDTFGRAFMGLTLGCARCHHHKFDPILTEDYYGLAGIFKSTRTMDHFIKFARWYENLLLTRETRALKEKNDRRLAELEAEIKKVVEAANKELQKGGKNLPPQPYRYYPSDVSKRFNELKAEASSLRDSALIPTALGATEREVVDVAVHRGGNHLQLGDIVPRRFPIALAGEQQQPFDKNQSGRLRLARWLVADDHPLTSRVMVNRLWRWHFGQGLVRSTDNFGKLGEHPDNQPLLDWLAIRLIDRDWSIKRMHQLITSSSTYRMSDRHNADAARIDPENRRHWRTRPRRLEAEAIRDALLAVGGQLDTTMGGSLMKTENRKHVFHINEQDKTSYDFSRRSVYLPIIRNHLYDVFSVFDYTDASMINGDRATTTIAPQALLMMNSDLVYEATEQMARQLLADDEAGEKTRSDADRIQWLYRTAYGRLASEEEIVQGISFLQQAESDLSAVESQFESPRLGAWQLLCQIVVAADEFIYIQ